MKIWPILQYCLIKSLVFTLALSIVLAIDEREIGYIYLAFFNYFQVLTLYIAFDLLLIPFSKTTKRIVLQLLVKLVIDIIVVLGMLILFTIAEHPFSFKALGSVILLDWTWFLVIPADMALELIRILRTRYNQE